MARGRKSYTLEEQLERVNADIENTEMCLEKLKEEKKDLEAQIRQQRLDEIDKLIISSGKTFDDIKAFLVG